jgi:hypothetical protein
VSQPNLNRVKPHPALKNPIDPSSETSPFRRSQPLASPAARSSGAVTITFGTKAEVASDKPPVVVTA